MHHTQTNYIASHTDDIPSKYSGTSAKDYQMIRQLGARSWLSTLSQKTLSELHFGSGSQPCDVIIGICGGFGDGSY